MLVDAWFAGMSIPAANSSFHYQKRTEDLHGTMN